MVDTFYISQFFTRFPDDDSCLEEIKRLRYPNGIRCTVCKEITKHYRVKKRTAYSCKECRNQIFPLTGTIFEKTSTPLQLWFFTLFLLTHTRTDISIKQLQKELGVTYKTAWRMYTTVRALMLQNNGDLVYGPIEFAGLKNEAENKVRKWVFFNTFEFKVVQRQKTSR